MEPLRILLCIALSLSVSAGMGQDVYKWVDDAGRLHYGDRPPDRNHAEQLTTPADRPGPVVRGEVRGGRPSGVPLERIGSGRDRPSQGDRPGESSRDDSASVDSRCMEMRRQLDILHYRAPVYLDEEGRYRVRWMKDTYAGERDYIDDATRASVIADLERRISRECAHQDADKANRTARRQNYRAEMCAAARVELEALQDPGRRSVSGEIEKAKRKVRIYCDR